MSCSILRGGTATSSRHAFTPSAVPPLSNDKLSSAIQGNSSATTAPFHGGRVHCRGSGSGLAQAEHIIRRYFYHRIDGLDCQFSCGIAELFEGPIVTLRIYYLLISLLLASPAMASPACEPERCGRCLVRVGGRCVRVADDPACVARKRACDLPSPHTRSEHHKAGAATHSHRPLPELPMVPMAPRGSVWKGPLPGVLHDSQVLGGPNSQVGKPGQIFGEPNAVTKHPARLAPARIYLRAADIPPAGVAAYGVVAFRAKPTSTTRDRLARVCEAYKAYLPSQKSLPASIPLSDQMLTI